MANNLFDPKMYKHVSSDKDKTVLKHKRGHTITVAHNAVDGKMRKALEALSKLPQEHATESQRQEEQDKSQYGKVIMKAEGGDIEPKTFLGQEIYGTGRHKNKPPERSGTMSGPNDEAWPLPSQTSVGKAIAAKKAAEQPQQPEEHAHGGVAGEQCKACGGPIKKMAEGGKFEFDPQAAVDAPMPDVKNLPSGRTSPPEMSSVDPEKSLIGPAVSQAAASVGDWLMNDPNKPQVKPADVAATTADANAEAKQAEANTAEGIAKAAHQQAAVQAVGQSTSPEAMAQKGLQSELAGAQHMGQAQGQLADAQAKSLEQDVARKQDIQKHFEQSYKQLDGERQAHIADIQKGYIDPNLYWKDHSKVAAGIGMILAGFNPTNRPNAAVEFLNHQMDMNLKAQEANLNSKNNLLRANLEQFHNAKDAADMTRVMQADVITQQLKQDAAKSANPMAKAAAEMAIGQINAKYQPIFMQLQIRHMMQGLGNGGTSTSGSTGQMLQGLDMVAPEQAKSYRERYYAPYDIPGGKSIADRPIDAKAREELNAHDKFNVAANNLHQIIAKSRGSINALNPVERNAAAQQALILQSLFREGTLGTVYREGEQPLLDKAVSGQPLGLVHYFTELPKLEGLMKNNEAMKHTTLESYGLRTPASPKQQSAPQQQPVKGKDGRMYIRQGNFMVPVK